MYLKKERSKRSNYGYTKIDKRKVWRMQKISQVVGVQFSYNCIFLGTKKQNTVISDLSGIGRC